MQGVILACTFLFFIALLIIGVPGTGLIKTKVLGISVRMLIMLNICWNIRLLTVLEYCLGCCIVIPNVKLGMISWERAEVVALT